MAYAPPSRTSIDATLATGYTPPARSGVDAVLGGAGATVRARAQVLHDWAIRSFARAEVLHDWAWLARAGCGHPYADRAVPRAQVVHWYGPAASPRATVDHPFGHRLLVRVVAAHPWAQVAGGRSLVVHPFGMISATARAAMDHAWAVESVARARVEATHLWWQHGPAVVGSLGGVSVSLAGAVLDDWASVDITWSREQFALSARIELADPRSWAACRPGAAVVLTLDGQPFALRIESRTRRRTGTGGWTWELACLSPAAWLDDPYAEPVEGERSGLASALAAALVAPTVLHWQTVDWAIPAATWIASGQSPLSLVRDLAAACGAVLVSRPDGSLAVAPAYPVAVPNWPTATPGGLVGDDETFEATETDDWRPGYNRYLVSDEHTAADSLRIDEEAETDHTSILRVYRTPWAGTIDLRHTGGSWVTLEALGVESRQVEEVVEIVAGEGRTQYPIYAVSALAWQTTNLGTVTHGEDGLLTTSVEGESLLAITYTTRCRKWRGRDYQPEQVQFVAEETA